MGVESVGVSEPSVPDKNVATDRINNKDYQAMKLMVGADGATDGFVSSGTPLPTQQKRTDSWTQSRVQVPDQTATLVAATNDSRLALWVQNQGDGASETLFLGPTSSVSNTGANKGTKFFPNQSLREYIYTGSIYAYQIGGATVDVIVGIFA